MPRGRQSKALRPDQIKRLQDYRISRRLSLPALNAVMGGREHYSWPVLARALDGRPVWELNYRYIVEWMERHVPTAPQDQDGKSAAAGREANDDQFSEQQETGRRGSKNSEAPAVHPLTKRGSN